MRLFTELAIFIIFTSLFLQGMAYGYPGAFPGATFDVPAPLKQLKIGLDVGEIECNKNMVLLIKVGNSSPACVKESTVTRILEHGWLYPTENDVDHSVQLDSINGLVNFLGKHYSVELGEVKSIAEPPFVQVILLDGSEIVVTEYQNKKEAINAAYQTYSEILNMGGDVDPICCTSYFLKDNLVIRVFYYYDESEFVEKFEVIMGSPFSELGGFQIPSPEYVDSVDDSVELNSINDLVNFLGKHYTIELGETKSQPDETLVQVVLLDGSEIVVTEYQNKKEAINAAYQIYSEILNMGGDVDPICCTSYFLKDNLVIRIYYYYDVPDIVEKFEVIMGSPFSELGGFQIPSREYVDSVDDLVKFLKEHKAIKIKEATTFIEPELGTGEVVSINGKYLHVFSFGSVEYAENAAVKIEEKIAQAYEERRKLGEEQNMIVDPACDFRYYILDYLIVVYVGYSEVVDMLNSSLGEPFEKTDGMNAGCDAINEGFLKNAG